MAKEAKETKKVTKVTKDAKKKNSKAKKVSKGPKESYVKKVKKELKLVKWPTAKEVLKACLGIEEKMGRQRLIKWGPRNIDIDILFYDKEIYE